MIYQVAVELDRESRPGGVARCHVLIPGSEQAVCGCARENLFIGDWTWSQISQLFRCHRCDAVAPDA